MWKFVCIIHIYIYEYFGKCFGLFTGASNFLTEMSQLFIIKICFTIKVNSICGAGRDTWNLCRKFNSQGPTLRILGLRVAISKSQGPISRVLGVRIPVPWSWVSGSCAPASRVSGSSGPGFQNPGVSGLMVPGPGSQVLILDYAIF